VRRGFKTEAERLAERLRAQLGLRPIDCLKIIDLARHLGVAVYSAGDLVSRTALDDLERVQPGSFSAATFHLPEGRTVAVYNPLREPGRTNSDIAHELAHVLLDHRLRDLQRIGGHTFFACDPDQEEEANWLAGCLLLPRPLLLHEAYAGATAESIAERYEVSLPMARFRLNASGVTLQVRRSSRPRIQRG